MSFRSEQDPGANMMRGIYLTVGSIIPTGMYGTANWHAAEGGTARIHYWRKLLVAATAGFAFYVIYSVFGR